MTTNFLGGMVRRGSGLCPERVGESWAHLGPTAEHFLRGAASNARVYLWDSLALLFRGYARPEGTSAPLDIDRVAEELRCEYLETGDLRVDRLDGSFSVALLDGRDERVILYRGLIGTGHLYYRATPGSFVFGANLAELIDHVGGRPDIDPEVLPAYFLFRAVPGRRTLHRDYCRVLPGEQVVADGRGVHRKQRRILGDLIATPVPSAEAVDRVEETMAAILRDCHSFRPTACNTLSGGIDSSYIQAVWNAEVMPPDPMPVSYSISVDHPMTWADTDYALSASRVLGTQHLLVPANRSYESYLAESVESTGEPTNHVQTAYFAGLAAAMADDGVGAGLCGEGADSLFGLGVSNQLQNAGILRRLMPLAGVRSLTGRVADILRMPRLAYTCRLANAVGDFSDREHPVNLAARFTDLEMADACFGREAVDAALAERRELGVNQGIADTVFDATHAAGFLGEAVDSAGLWATLFQGRGVDMLCPFLDTRMLRLALNLRAEDRYKFRMPKDLLRKALSRRGGESLAYRSKLGFGQPIFEWMREGGQLRTALEEMPRPAFVPADAMRRIREKPTWAAYSLIVLEAVRRREVAVSRVRVAV